MKSRMGLYAAFFENEEGHYEILSYITPDEFSNDGNHKIHFTSYPLITNHLKLVPRMMIDAFAEARSRKLKIKICEFGNPEEIGTHDFRPLNTTEKTA